FINLADNRGLDAEGFVPFGRVVEGMKVADALYGGYGESSGGGIRGGKQQPLFAGATHGSTPISPCSIPCFAHGSCPERGGRLVLQLSFTAGSAPMLQCDPACRRRWPGISSASGLWSGRSVGWDPRRSRWQPQRGCS